MGFNMKLLALSDLKHMNEYDVKEHLISEYTAPESIRDTYEVLIAYENNDSYDSTSYFLLKDKSDGRLYEIHASHCSCHGFEDQFDPKEVTAKYLKSVHFSFGTGEGDDDLLQAVRDYLVENLNMN